MAIFNGTAWEIRDIVKTLCLSLGLFWPLLDEYLRLLWLDSRKHRPLTAYLAGKSDQVKGTDFETGIREYLNKEAERDFLTDDGIEACFQVLWGMGKKQKSLLWELRMIYIEAYGTVNRSIGAFYEMGYYTNQAR